jgi:ATPase subunit of ABC transporter with duplicated ATPase domains
MRGQLEEARRRKEIEARELNRQLHLSGQQGGQEIQRIAVVGPCGSGKSTLVNILRDHDYNAYSSAQEHSYVPTMWMMTNPSHLIYLDVRLETIRQRRQISWGEEYLQAENRRLAHARDHADIIIETDHFTLEQVVRRALDFLELLKSA